MTDLRTQARDLLGGPVKDLWRRIRPHLPPRAAEAIRVPVKQGLRKAGLIGPRPAAR